MKAMRLFLLVLAIGALASVPAAAQSYPAKTVKIIVGTSPGGSPDVFARLIAQKMSESWGPVVIENRIGANGNIAAEMVSKSAPDGYTAYVCDSAIWAINPHLYAKVPYRTLADFAGISTISTLPTFLTVHPSVPAATYAEFIAYAKKNPGKLSYASPGNGSTHHITTELFKSLAGISMVHVPYKGMGQAGPALIAGDVQVAFSSYTAMAQYARAGKVRILASADGKRTPALPREAQRRRGGRSRIARGPRQDRGVRSAHRHEHARAVRRADARRIREVREAGEALRREARLTVSFPSS